MGNGAIPLRWINLFHILRKKKGHKTNEMIKEKTIIQMWHHQFLNDHKTNDKHDTTS